MCINLPRLDAADSKATVLQKLCDRVRFKPELAALMHKSMYKQKVETILAEEKKITDERDEELSRLRKLMCIPEVKKSHLSTYDNVTL